MSSASQVDAMPNPYVPPQTASVPPASAGAADDSQAKRGLVMYRVSCAAVGIIATPVAAMILCGTAMYYLQSLVTLGDIWLTTTLALCLLFAGVASLFARLEGTCATAILFSLAMLWSALGKLLGSGDDSTDDSWIGAVVIWSSGFLVLLLTASALLTARMTRRRRIAPSQVDVARDN